MTIQEIEKDWEWLSSNVCETLHSFDKEEDITEFVIKKIESVIATNQESQDFEGMRFLSLGFGYKCLVKF